MRAPLHLRSGDRIGVISPASPIDAEELNAGLDALEARGYHPVVGKHALKRVSANNYLAGTDEQRVEDLHSLFADESIAALICARGGYGSMRLYPHLDMTLIGKRPRIFVGYSDITSLHLALNQQANLITFHGPNLTEIPKLSALSSECFWRLLENPSPFGTLPSPQNNIQTLVEGVTEGELAGGNLCLLAHACGSRFTPDFRGKIVLIEDVGEAIYRADRDLIQLRNAGQLDLAAGFVVGAVSHWRSQENATSINTPEALWRDILGGLGKPAITGFLFGHESDPLTLPLGVRARLDADAGTLTLLESATL